MRMHLVFFLAVISFFAIVEASYARGIDPKKLSLPVEQISYDLDAPYTYKTVIGGIEVNYTIMAGTYKSELMGNDGVFLRGPEKCVEIKVLPRSPEVPIIMRRDGGVFLSGAGGMIYFYRQRDNQDSNSIPNVSNQVVTQNFPRGTPPTAGVVGGAIGTAIVSAMINSGMGNIFFPQDHKPDASLKNGLKPLPEEQSVKH